MGFKVSGVYGLGLMGFRVSGFRGFRVSGLYWA